MNKTQNTAIVSDIYSTLGSAGLLVANMAFNFIPGANIFFLAMSCLTSGILIDDMLSSKWQKLFDNLGLYTKDKQYPKHIKEEENQIEIKHYFKLPVGISSQDFLRRQELIESALKRKVKIEQENGCVTIREFKMQTAELKWEEVFIATGFRNKEGKCPKLIEVIETKIGNRYIFKLPYGICFNDFEKYKPLFESAFHKPLKLDLTSDYKLIVQIYDVKFKKRYKPKYDVVSINNLIYPLGIALTIDGEQEVLIDLTDEAHILVAGINGSGKTCFIKCLLTAMCIRQVELKIIDLKMGGDYNAFKKYKNLTAFINHGDDIIDQANKEIKNVRKIVSNRYAELNKTSCSNYKDYNKKFDNAMKPLVVLIEEYVLISDDKQSKRDLNILLAQARACNVKFILSLQRPCHENLDPKIKANCNHVVGFRVNNTFNSGIVLGQGDDRLFTDIHSAGEAILANSNQDVMFKSYYLDDWEIEKIIKPYCDNMKKADTVVEDNRVIQLVPKSKQLAVLEKSKVHDLL